MIVKIICKKMHLESNLKLINTYTSAVVGSMLLELHK